MASKDIAVYGIYKNRSMVESAVDQLKSEGFRSSDISVLFPEGGGTKEFAVEKETKTPEGTTTGAGTGVVIGGALGWLTGIGMLAIPGLGPFIAAGPIMATLAGAGAGGVIGGIAGALIGMGIPEYEANRYEGRIKEGGILLSVHADDRDWKNKAKDLLQRTGAEDIGYKGEADADSDASDEKSSDRYSSSRPSVDRPMEAPYSSSDASYTGSGRDTMERRRAEDVHSTYQPRMEDRDLSDQSLGQGSLGTGSSTFTKDRRQAGFERRKGERRKSGMYGSHI